MHSIVMITDEHVCLYICLYVHPHTYFWKYMSKHGQIVCVCYGHGSILLYRHCDTLCTVSLWMTSCLHVVSKSCCTLSACSFIYDFVKMLECCFSIPVLLRLHWWCIVYIILFCGANYVMLVFKQIFLKDLMSIYVQWMMVTKLIC